MVFLPYSKDVLDRFHQNRASLVLAKIRTHERLRHHQVDSGLCARVHRATCLMHNEAESSKWPGRTCRPLQHTFHDAQPRPKDEQ